jgi:hypothetical protein
MAAPMIRLAFSTLNFFRLQSFEDTVFLSSPQGQLWRNEYSKPSAWPSLSTNTGLGGSVGQAAIDPEHMKTLP